MLNTYEINALLKLNEEERHHIAKLNRELRAESSRKAAERRLHKEVTRFMRSDGNARVVLNLLETSLHKAEYRVVQGGSSTCCS